MNKQQAASNSAATRQPDGTVSHSLASPYQSGETKVHVLLRSGHVPVWRVRFCSHITEAVPLTKEWTIGGRHPACDIVFDSGMVNRRHFAIRLWHGGCYVQDLKSSCGTMLRCGSGGGSGRLGADCEVRPGSCRIFGCTPLRAGDVFGHPVCSLTLERAVPMTVDEWLSGSSSQSMLLALRDSPFAGPGRLRLFLDRCLGFLGPEHLDETTCRRLREHPDTWTAAAGLARFVVAVGSDDRGLRGLFFDEVEFALCRILRECFDNPIPGASPHRGVPP